MKKAKIIVIGDEILLGRVTDTNSGAIARALDPIGAKVIEILTIPDDSKVIKSTIEKTIGEADILFTTGGLGPTKDDRTRNEFLAIFGEKMVMNDDVLKNIENIFEKRGLSLNELTKQQAIVPSSAHIIQNRLGTAPIMVFKKNGTILVAMPGVPFETEGMLPDVVDYLQNNLNTDYKLKHETRVLTGISESALAQRLEQFEEQLPKEYNLAYLPDSPILKLRLDGPVDNPDFKQQTAFLDKILFSLPEVYILSNEDRTLPEIVLQCLEKLQLTLSTAESCTGGNIAHLITSVPGSSAIFYGSVVSYANSVKTNVLDVSEETLQKNGAVSQQVVTQMVDGVSRIMCTDCAIATSGIAGPSGGTPDKPVGTVWIAVKTPKGINTQCFKFSGDRKRIIKQASATALIMLLKNI